MATVPPPSVVNANGDYANGMTLPGISQGVRLDREYVASLTYGPPTMPTGVVKRGIRRLPPYIDDLQRSVRFDVYEQMLLDGQVKACFNLMIAGIIGGGMDIMPASKSGEADYKKDVEVADFCATVLTEHLSQSFIYDIIPDYLKSMAVGHRIGEKVYHPIEESPIKGKYVLQRVNLKHRRQVAFVVDYFMNVLGIASTPYGMLTPADYEVIDREKFAIMTWKPVDNDPRGTSELRSVYEPWWRKQRYRPQQIRYLDSFASPSLYAVLAEGSSLRQQIDPATGQPAIDLATGKPIYIDRAKELVGALEQFQNTSILVLPFGTELHVIEVQGDGRAFIMALEGDNTEIAKSILGATLATEQGPNQGRAASETHANAVSVNVDYGIGITEGFVRREFLEQLVDLNYPQGTRVPRVRFPGANKADFLAWASAIAKLQLAEFLDPSQFPGIDAKLQLPARSDQGLQETIASTTKQRKMAGEKPPAASGPQKTARQSANKDTLSTT